MNESYHGAFASSASRVDSGGLHDQHGVGSSSAQRTVGVLAECAGDLVIGHPQMA